MYLKNINTTIFCLLSTQLNLSIHQTAIFSHSSIKLCQNKLRRETILAFSSTVSFVIKLIYYEQ